MILFRNNKNLGATDWAKKQNRMNTRKTTTITTQFVLLLLPLTGSCILCMSMCVCVTWNFRLQANTNLLKHTETNKKKNLAECTLVSDYYCTVTLYLFISLCMHVWMYIFACMYLWIKPGSATVLQTTISHLLLDAVSSFIHSLKLERLSFHECKCLELCANVYI